MQSSAQDTKTKTLVKACQTEADVQLRGQSSYCMRRTHASCVLVLASRVRGCWQRHKFLTWRSPPQRTLKQAIQAIYGGGGLVMPATHTGAIVSRDAHSFSIIDTRALSASMRP